MLKLRGCTWRVTCVCVGFSERRRKLLIKSVGKHTGTDVQPCIWYMAVQISIFLSLTVVCRVDAGTLKLMDSSEQLLWSVQVDHQLFALQKLDVTVRRRDMFPWRQGFFKKNKCHSN